MRELWWKLQLRIGLGDTFFGPGVARFLALAEEKGSISAAAKALDLSYSKALKMVRNMERELGISIMERQAGGPGGGASYLTEDGKRFLAAYSRFEAEMIEAGNALFPDCFSEFSVRSDNPYFKDKVWALITAAGLSSRMGDFKPLIPIGDKSMVQTVIQALRDGGVAQIAVVTGHRDEDIRAHLKDSGVKFIFNENYASSQMFDSIRLGVSHIADECDRLIFSPVDTPFFTAGTVRALLKSPNSAAFPVYEGSPGHPVMLSSTVFSGLAGYSGEGGLRGFLENSVRDLAYIEVDDPGVLPDVDTPEQYKRLLTGKRHLFIEGVSGVGKTTLLSGALKSFRGKVGGFVTRRMSGENGEVKGFYLAPVGALFEPEASAAPESSFFLRRVGEVWECDYASLAKGALALLENLDDVDLVVIDEIGGFELLDEAFRERVEEIVLGDLPCLCVLKSPQGRDALSDTVGFTDGYGEVFGEFRDKVLSSDEVEFFTLRPGNYEVVEGKVAAFLDGVGK